MASKHHMVAAIYIARNVYYEEDSVLYHGTMLRTQVLDV